MEIGPEFDMGPMDFDSGGFESSSESFDSGSFDTPNFETPSEEMNSLPDDFFIESEAMAPEESIPEFSESEPLPSGIIESDSAFESNSSGYESDFESEPIAPSDVVPAFIEKDASDPVEILPVDELTTSDAGDGIYEEQPVLETLPEQEVPAEEWKTAPDVMSDPDLFDEVPPDEALHDPDIFVDTPPMNPDESANVEENFPKSIDDSESPILEPALEEPLPDYSGILNTPEPIYGEPGSDDPRMPGNPEPGWHEPGVDDPVTEHESSTIEVSSPENYSPADEAQQESEQYDGPERPENQKNPEIVTENEPGGSKRPSRDVDPDQTYDDSFNQSDTHDRGIPAYNGEDEMDSPTIDDEPDWNDPDVSPLINPDSTSSSDDQPESAHESDFAQTPTREADDLDYQPQNQANIDDGVSGPNASYYSADSGIETPEAEDVQFTTPIQDISDQPSGQTSNLNDGDDGVFSINDWEGYPPDGPKPEGPFRLVDGVKYEEARNEANKANHKLHKEHPEWEDLQIHEIQPVKFGGSPTDPANKIALTPAEHAEYTTYWNNVQRYKEKYQ